MILESITRISWRSKQHLFEKLSRSTEKYWLLVQQILSQNDLKSKAIRGSIWTVTGFGATQIIRFVSNLILSRLLFPDAFGLMALVGMMLQGLQMFSDVGIGQAIIQKEHGRDAVFLDTAWTLQVARGVLLTIMAILVALPISVFYGEPILLPLISVAGITSLISGFTTTNTFAVERDITIGRQTLIAFVSQIISFVSVVAAAYVTRSVWALVLGGLANAMASTVMSNTLLPGHRNKFAWDKKSVTELFHFGRWIFVGTIVSFVGQQFDRIYLGKVVSKTELGVYGIATIIASMFVASNMQLIRRVGFPTLSRIYREKRSEFADSYRRIRQLSDFAFLPVLGLLTVFAPHLIHLLYDARYQEAGVILQFLCAGAALQCVLEPTETCLMALGQPRWATARYTVRTVFCVIGIPMGWYVAQMVGVLTSIILCEIPVFALFGYALKKNGLFSLRSEITSILAFAVPLVFAYAVTRFPY